MPHATVEEINVFLFFFSLADRANFNGNEETLKTLWSIDSKCIGEHGGKKKWYAQGSLYSLN